MNLIDHPRTNRRSHLINASGGNEVLNAGGNACSHWRLQAKTNGAFGPHRPVISEPLLRWFTWYSRRYLRRHFHALRISRAGLPPVSALPLVIYSNHASWWDPLVCLVLKAEFYSGRQAFAPIDAASLDHYPMLRRFGFFGVEQNSRRGALRFLEVAEAILREPANILAITPQSRFADVRLRPPQFRAGLGHLASRVNHAAFVSMAVEYVFWEERLPEIVVRFGQVDEVRHSHSSAQKPKDWSALLERRLEATQDALSLQSQSRNPDEFQTVLRGGAGQGGVYDAWRWFTSRVRRRTFRKEHGNT